VLKKIFLFTLISMNLSSYSMSEDAIATLTKKLWTYHIKTELGNPKHSNPSKYENDWVFILDSPRKRTQYTENKTSIRRTDPEFNTFKQYVISNIRNVTHDDLSLMNVFLAWKKTADQ
jgi:hypothetical protein